MESQRSSRACTMLGLAFEPARDLGGDLLIPQLPAQTVGNGLRDIRRAASVFAFDADDLITSAKIYRVFNVSPIN